jgi:hypothetical protein
VSPLWRDELRIWFAPGELRLRRMQRGIRPSCAADATLPVDSTSDWRPALESLEGCLGVQTWSGAGIRVVVSPASAWLTTTATPALTGASA